MLLFSALGGTGSAGASSANLTISVKYISNDLVIGCTMIWIFIMSFSLTKKTPEY
ncbi:MAG: hypothetical protein GX207_03835 [Peptococcaceae bacterium]|nr:hypothetical protein [Peptococcaceae bacterium]